MKLNKRRLSISMMFFICGTGISCWAPMVPFAQKRLRLDNAHLGLLLLAFGIGSIFAMILSGRISSYLGSRKPIIIGGSGMALMLPCLLFLSTSVTLGAALFFFGVFSGLINVSMNVQALAIQKSYGKHILSSFHGLFSIGGLVGSAGFSLLLKTGFADWFAVTILSIGMLLIIFTQQKHLTIEENTPAVQEKFRFNPPSGTILLIGIIAMMTAITEGAMLDWSGIFLTSVSLADLANAGYGFAFFSVAMSVCRMTGDYLVVRLGKLFVTGGGCLLAALGIGIIIFLPSLHTALIGFLITGIGLANVFPVLFSTAGTLSKTDPRLALPIISGMAYGGMLAGPAIIGLIAQATSLSFTFGLLGILIILAGGAFGLFLIRSEKKLIKDI